MPISVAATHKFGVKSIIQFTLYAIFRVMFVVGNEEDFYWKMGTNARNYYAKAKV